MWADIDAMAQQFRRHMETLDYCATGLDNAVRTINEAVTSNPYGVLLAHVPQLYLEQHHRQVDLMEYLARGLRSLADQLAVTAAVCGGEEVSRPSHGAFDYHDVSPVAAGNRLTETPPAGAYPLAPGEPVRAMLDDPQWLIGDLEAMELIAEVWGEVSEELAHIGGHLEGLSQLDGSWGGETAANYVRYFDINVTVLQVLSTMALGMSGGMRTCVSMSRVSHQWLDSVRVDYEDALGGRRRRVRVADQVGWHLAYQGLIAAMTRSLRSQMADGRE